MPYKPQDGAFHFIATVQLPKEVDEQLMLEVSPRHVLLNDLCCAFLDPAAGERARANDAECQRRNAQKHVQVDLAWDGLDHNRQQVPGRIVRIRSAGQAAQ